MQVGVQAVGRDRGAGQRGSRPVRRQFGFQALGTEHAGTGTGHRDPNALRAAADEHADDRKPRRRLLELLPARFLGHREAHRGDHFTVGQRGFVQAGEEVVGGDAAAVGVDGRAQAQHGSGVARRRVVVGQAAAYRAAVANLTVADLASQVGQRGDRSGESGVRGHRSVGAHRADLDHSARHRDVVQAGDAGQVDQRLGRGQAEFHRREQRLAAGNQLGTIGAGSARGFSQRRGFGISKSLHGNALQELGFSG